MRVCITPIVQYIVGIFYFILGNVQPKFRSKLSSIQLVAIVKSTVLSAYGMDAVLRPFVDDLKKLVRFVVFQPLVQNNMNTYMYTVHTLYTSKSLSALLTGTRSDV